MQWEQKYNCLFLQASVRSEGPAGNHGDQLQQGGGEDESERGGAPVEDQEQLRAPCGDLLAHIPPSYTAEV